VPRRIRDGRQSPALEELMQPERFHGLTGGLKYGIRLGRVGGVLTTAFQY
jgi:hypothetical protein